MHASVWIMDKVVFIGLIVACFAAGSASAATILPSAEVDGLRDIGVSLGKTGWDFNANPCNGERGWVDPHPNNDTGYESNVTCNCFVPNDTFCHVIRISLKAQNLSGTLPPASQLLKLPYLGELDLSRNYLNGTIPPEWGSLNLTYISLLGNRLTGSIPPELGNMSSLISFVVDINQLSGVLPPELGNLSRIERLHLCSNNFSGELPGTLVKLTTLTDFRISDNQFSGRIPEFIQNWTNLTKLMIQASGLQGPIPSAVSVLKKMNDLRISDLKGAEATFPNLTDLTSLSYLILRSCNIIGLLPPYLGNMVKLKTLDLSFNKLNGTIPQSYDSLRNVDFIFLTRNFITGAVPDWILNKGDDIDLSYNKLTISKPEEIGCLRRGIVNLFKSSLDHNNSGIASCLRSFNCTKEFYSFNINCGGMEVSNVYGNTTFEADKDNGGPSKFVRSETNWAFSNTGQFMDNGRPMDPYTIDTDASRLSMQNSKLYLSARISAISLTYYGFCLINGSYTITLHFAEIQFFDNNTYFSLGRRIFDIYIQGVLVEENFNIAERAGGFGLHIMRKYSTEVNDSTLEIRFHWSGKGTTGIPVRGVYGPLISAISVISDSIPQSDNRNSISIGAVTGIIIAGTFIILLLLGTLWWKQCIVCKNRRDQDLQGRDLQTGTFTLRQIKAATNNFDVSNKIGEGGFGSVYKGILLDGTVIAVKQLSSKSKQGNREFVNEIGMISALQHPHLVKLFGCCIEGNQLLLVYEYMENNSLARALFGPSQCQLQLDWPTRHKICVGIARGLAFLHEESRLKIVHRDIKATNVLLDKHLNSKISDFGLAKLDEEDTHISTRIAGTYGYMAPEYAMRGYLTDKADVYSFGIVALEIVCGRSNTSHRAKENSFYLLDWANFLKEKGDLIELVDPRLGGNFKHEEVITMIKVGLLCTNASASHRPAMSSVVSMLEGKAAVQEFPDPTLSDDEMKVEEMRDHFRSEIQDENLSQSMYIGGPSTGSSTSAGDLYPISLGSSYLEQRN